MTTILPAERTPFEAIMSQIGSGLSQTLPGAIQQRGQRELGLNALDQAQKEIAKAGGDPYKIAMAFARAGSQNPELSRALGPLAQTAMSQAAVNRAFPPGPGGQNAPSPPSSIAPQPSVGGQTPQGLPQPPTSDMQAASGQESPSEFAKPSPFNIMTVPDMEAESKRYAISTNNPDAYTTRFANLERQNEQATLQRQALEKFALDADVAPADLPRFMLVGSKFDTRNPAEWAQNAKRAYAEVKSNDEKLQKAFIPGLGSGLLGKDRDATLKKLQKTVQDQVSNGLEQETRKFLADQYLSPTEVESLIHPLQPTTEKSIQSLQNGDFKIEKASPYDIWGFPSQPKISYEEMLERNPEKLQEQQNILSDFFLRNVKPDTSLLVMREKLWKDKGYDWRQIGPAIRQAEEKGLKLQRFQSTEMPDIETQPPLQSLPDIFQDWGRIIPYLRGSK